MCVSRFADFSQVSNIKSKVKNEPTLSFTNSENDSRWRATRSLKLGVYLLTCVSSVRLMVILTHVQSCDVTTECTYTVIFIELVLDMIGLLHT